MITFDPTAMLAALHKLKEGHGLPFAVKLAGGDPIENTAIVAAAASTANREAETRNPVDPTSANDPMPVPNGQVVAELDGGTFTDEEVLAWFTDFVTALDSAVGDRDGEVRHLRSRPRVPNVDDWPSGPPSLTAYLNFVPEDPAAWGWEITPEVVAACEGVADWITQVPGGTTAISRAAAADFVLPASRAAVEFRTSFGVDYQHDLYSVTLKPRRGRLVRFLCTDGQLQVVDETRPPVKCLPDLLEGVRLLAPYLLQARIRLGRSVNPDENDVLKVYGREPTPAEVATGMPATCQLAADYLVDAYVAQVLTGAHLAKIGHPDGFTVEDLGHDRYLVLAEDPEPWLAGPVPDDDVLEAARRQFAPALLTPEIISANRRSRP